MRLSGFTKFLLQVVLCLGLLYAGGWEPIWEEDIFSHKDFLVEDHGFAVRVNDKYYGLRFHARFFDSPVVSWGLLMATLGITPVFLIPFGGKSGSSNALD